jgi:hypothetical protein
VNHQNDAITRRAVLGGALGAAVVSMLDAQTPNSPARIRDTFDFGWKFLKGDAPGAQAPAFADAAWRSVDLPHDWSVEGPFAQNELSGGAGGNAPTGIGWYRKHFRVPPSYKDRKLMVEFDGVLSEQRGLDQRAVPRQAPLRVYQLRLRHRIRAIAVPRRPAQTWTLSAQLSRILVGRRAVRERAVDARRAGHRVSAYLNSTPSTVIERNEVDMALSRAAADSR